MLHDYWRLKLKFTRPLLATCPDASIYKAHVLDKAKKMIKEANKLSGKVTKKLEKYVNADISEVKEYRELAALCRRYQEILGQADTLPENIDELMEYIKSCEEEIAELIKKGEQQHGTVFMRDKDGHAVISSHCIVGMIKYVLKTQVNNSDKAAKLIKSKVQVQEIIGMDLRPVEEFLKPSEDLVRDEKGEPLMLERPIRFEDSFGKTVSSIALSEQVPAGAEIEATLRIRKNSVLNDSAVLNTIFTLGKNVGIGQNRRSGFGAFVYKLEKLDDYKEPTFDGWN